MKITPTIAKLQLAVNTQIVSPQPRSQGPKAELSFSKVVMKGTTIQRWRKPKIRNRLQKLVKKHFFNKPKSRLDLMFVTKLARL